MNEQPPDLIHAEPAATPPPAKASLWEDFLDIFYAPSEVFARRQAGGWWPSLLILVVLTTLLFVAWQQALGPVMELDMQRTMADAVARNPELTAEDVERMAMVGRVAGIVVFAAAFPLIVAMLGVLLWLVGQLFGSVATISSLIMVATYAQVVRLPQYLAGILQAALLDVQELQSIHDVSFSLARFMDPDRVSASVLALGARVEVFTLWATVLLAIGLHVVGRVPKGSAYAAAFLVWAIAALPQVLGPLLGGG